MKLIIYLILLLPIIADAQILNQGFEESGNNGAPRHWMRYLPAATQCFSNPNFDLICRQSTDARTGNYALELRNIICAPGIIANGNAAMNLNDTNSLDIRVPFTEQPSFISFYYKLITTTIDHVTVNAFLFDSNNNLVAKAEEIISDTSSIYVLKTIPVNYINSNNISSIALTFLIDNEFPPLGTSTRFLIDDISTLTTSTAELKPNADNVKLFPNPTQGLLTIACDKQQNLTLTISNTIGQTVFSGTVVANSTIDINSLTSGIYLYTLSTKLGTIAKGRFVKE